MGDTTTTSTFLSNLNLLQMMTQPSVMETFVDILLCTVPIWLAIMIGLLIGWSWKPRWSGLLFLGFRSKLRFLWTAPPGFGARRLWLAFTALSVFSLLKTLFSSFFVAPKRTPLLSHHPPPHSVSAHPITRSDGTPEVEHDVVSEKDLEHLLQILDGKDGEISWQSMMERTTLNMSYQAWRHEPENGPTIYRSRTVFEDVTAELVRDFFWDDEFRPKWDRMLTYFKILVDCSHTGTMIVHWIKKFPFFCSDREYIIGRRIWEAGKAYYCITKGVPYPNLPKRDKPRRVERYFSSWVIKPAKSLKGDGSMTACEVCLVHYEDMGIPKDVAKLGVRHGMWDTVKKLHAGMRAYQSARRAEASLSRCALMASITTKISFDGVTMPHGASDEEEQSQVLNSHGKHGVDLKWVLIGGTVAVIFGLQTGVLRKALMFGARRKFGAV